MTPTACVTRPLPSPQIKYASCLVVPIILYIYKTSRTLLSPVHRRHFSTPTKTNKRQHFLLLFYKNKISTDSSNYQLFKRQSNNESLQQQHDFTVCTFVVEKTKGENASNNRQVADAIYNTRQQLPSSLRFRIFPLRLLLVRVSTAENHFNNSSQTKQAVGDDY